MASNPREPSFAPTALWFADWAQEAVDAGDLRVASLSCRRLFDERFLGKPLANDTVDAFVSINADGSVTVFTGNHAHGLPSHQAAIMVFDPATLAFNVPPGE